MTLRVGLLGCGYWGTRLLRVFGEMPDVDMTIVVDPDGAARRAVGGAVATASEAEVLWSDRALEAVLIATPPATHYELARAALLAGKHCWVEKPLTLSLPEARELIRLAENQQRRLFVDETFLYDPLIRTARDWIAAGRIGALQHLSLERVGLGRVRRDSDVWWNAAPHDLSILRFLVSERVESLRVDGFAHFQMHLADHCVAALRLEGGASVHMYLSWLSPEKRAAVVAVGDAGMLRYEGRFAQRELVLYDYALGNPAGDQRNVVASGPLREREHMRGGDEEPLALAARAFVDLVARGVEAPSEGRLALGTVELLQRGADAAASSELSLVGGRR